MFWLKHPTSGTKNIKTATAKQLVTSHISFSYEEGENIDKIRKKSKI